MLTSLPGIPAVVALERRFVGEMPLCGIASKENITHCGKTVKSGLQDSINN